MAGRTVGGKAIRVALALFIVAIPASLSVPTFAATQQQSGSIGVEGTVPGSAPSQAPTIGVPSNGQSFTSIPITVSGLCKSGLLVEVFDNGVFVGSTQCSNGSYSLQIDLFSGTNTLVARQYDSLNQASPDSSGVTVTFNNSVTGTGSLVSINSQYSKRGADPGSELTWPLSISGGNGPYAVSVDWGDNTPPELVSLPGPGNFNIQHIYQEAGTFNVTIQATDVNGNSAFLQVVGVANGAVQQSNKTKAPTAVTTKGQVIWWLYALLFLLAITTFWLGKKHQLELIRSRLRRGERPFK